MPRYVILRHELPAGNPRPTHWDLMLESAGALRTWALADEPAAGLACDAEQLADHRLDYLTYEGPVSGDRGHVTRWDEGAWQLASETPSALVATLTGSRLVATVTLNKGDGSHCWRASFSAAPKRG